MRITTVLRWTVTGAVLSAAPAALGQAEFTPLGSLGSSTFSLAHGVSADGTTVVGASQYRAFRWRAVTGMVQLDDPLPLPWEKDAVACSADGSIVVGCMTDRSDEPAPWWPSRTVRWSATGEATILPDEWEGQWPVDSRPNGLSADGLVIVGAYHTNAAIWSTLGLPTMIAPFASAARAITPDGNLVYGSINHAMFRWSAPEGLTTVGVAGSPAALSADGQVVTGSTFGNPRLAFVWTADSGMVTLGDLPGGGFSSDARAISADGSRIVGRASTQSPLGSEAFVYEAALGMRNLRHMLVRQHGLGALLQGWMLVDATGTSADGNVIVGFGHHPGTTSWEAFRAILPRCPGDYNRDGAFTPADVVAFIAAWFDSLAARNDWGDFDLDDHVTPADVAAFVKAWYAAATGACQ